MDYKQYRADTGITSKDMIRVVRDIYPNYSKITQSMVDNPEKYGICLLPAAEKAVTSHFGEPDKAPPPKRKKAHRLVVYLEDEPYQEVRACIEEQGVSTQEFLHELLIQWLCTIDEISQ